MLIDDFKRNYTTIPFATYARDHKKNIAKCDVDTLFHMHREMEVLLVQRGEAMLYLETEIHMIRKGDIILIAPYTLHRYTILASKDFKHVCACFDLRLLYDKELKRRLEEGEITVPCILQDAEEQYGRYFLSAVEAEREKKTGWELRVIGNLSLLFGDLLQEGCFVFSDRTKDSHYHHRIVAYIAAHYGEPITSTDVAAFLHINNSYFCRLFHASFGYCFQTYLCMYRIEKAKALLKNAELSVSEIAATVGFNSFSYFSKMFKVYTAVTPSQFRKTGKDT